MMRVAPELVASAIKLASELPSFNSSGTAGGFEKGAERITKVAFWLGTVGLVTIGLLGFLLKSWPLLTVIRPVVVIGGVGATVVLFVGMISSLCGVLASLMRGWRERRQLQYDECVHDLANVNRLLALGSETIEAAIRWLQYKIDREEGRIFRLLSPLKIVGATLAGASGLSALKDVVALIPSLSHFSVWQFLDGHPFLLPLIGAPVGFLLGAGAAKLAVNGKKRELEFLMFVKQQAVTPAISAIAVEPNAAFSVAAQAPLDLGSRSGRRSENSAPH
jgi:hypothetical protein